MAYKLTPTEKLHARLEQLGFKVVTWMPALGYWRHIKADVCCWQAHCKYNGQNVTITSWHTVTECLRYGIKVEKDTGPYGSHGDYDCWLDIPRKEEPDGE